jgi:urea transport system permease protein
MNFTAAIWAMQAFNGLSNFCVLLLMALGLAIVFGQMGVINMAHGEFLTVGAYTTYLLSQVSERWLPALTNWYFFVAIVVAFVLAGSLGLLVEHVIVRRLYRRPLDTLLATWGLSLVMQQTFRFNVRATMQNRVMAGAVGINTARIDRLTFGLGCGLAGIAGAAFTTIGSTGPTSGSLYIVNTFLVVVFGGAQSLFGTIASAFSIAQTQATAEFFMTGSMATVLTLSAVILILLVRPQGLFALKVRR